MSPSFNLSGTVINENNEAIIDAQIMIVDAPQEHLDIALLTDSNGCFVLKGLSSGQYTIAINAENFKPKTITIKVISELQKIKISLEKN